MARAEPRVRKKVWRKIGVALMVGVLAIGALIYLRRYEIAVWYMDGNKKAQEMAIHEMLENARPIIEKHIKMTFLEKAFGSATGKRNEKERQADALKDVRRFGEFCFEKHMLKFRDVHKLGSMNGFDLHGYNFALGWNRGDMDEVLAAFDVNFLKRKIGKMQINQNCSYFDELRQYVKKKAEGD